MPRFEVDWIKPQGEIAQNNKNEKYPNKINMFGHSPKIIIHVNVCNNTNNGGQ